ncbi:protein kinase family protein [Rhynchospora pubera]|uniref:non-specific serine/threonine protein kinase n=1 Tax=Rhynchospora pubera TaxID=906938 RepID=A0AAV8EA09_9POAL|nr:protein kinase family protein [Rhynchospora pubera]
MEIPKRGTNTYSVLNQLSDDYDPSLPPLPLPLPLPLQLQRQSSGSSYGDSSLSLSGDCCFFAPPPLDAITGAKSEPITGGSGSGSGSGKSWAQQAEETYQLQLALALRLCSEAASVSDPGLMESGDASTAPVTSSAVSAEALSHRFWVNGSLSYIDSIQDGFYVIRGMDPFVWSLCTDVQEESRMPTLVSLKNVDWSDSSIEVVLFDKKIDSYLRQLHNSVVSTFSSFSATASTKDMVEQLAKLVSSRMGGAALNLKDEEALLSRWRDSNSTARMSTHSVVIPLGQLSVGLCIHRSLLFKMLADSVNVPCRVVKGCKYCTRDDATSCLVRFGLEREYLVDLIGDPGHLSEPDSQLNGPNSMFVSSPLHPPRFKSMERNGNFKSLAKQYFSECQSLNLSFKDTKTTSDLVSSDQTGAYVVPAAAPSLPFSNLRPPDMKITESLARINPSRTTNPSPNRDIVFSVDDYTIPWRELILKEKIGAGSFGTVHRADWHGSDVAVKILIEQDFHADRLKEFMREVAIMKSLRHPNIVLLMGVVTEPPNLSIVTEYLSRGSLYKLLHKSTVREYLDERRRLHMAFDVAKGMNYLHRRNPPIVHRDLKSPNLLVDRKYTVKVCDFGLSRLKASTYLSSKSLAGTPEWMAPEVLRDELSNEKSDVYSFGVILWELMTLQQPWSNLNPAQVVAAVGFKGRRLEIPKELNPRVTSLIESCWADEPWKRPSFASIMESLKPLLIVCKRFCLLIQDLLWLLSKSWVLKVPRTFNSCLSMILRNNYIRGPPVHPPTDLVYVIFRLENTAVHSGGNSLCEC